MATSTEKFRNALNGFNRTDVVQFIQRQTAEHEKALRLAREENARLAQSIAEAAHQNEELEKLQAENAALLEEREQLLREQAALQEKLAEAIAAATAASAAPMSTASVAELDRPIQPVVNDFSEMELAAYRRAEMTERAARERAAASAERMKNIFAQADAKLNMTSTDLTAVLSACTDDFTRLQALLSAAKEIFAESSEGLKAAAELCNDFP